MENFLSLRKIKTGIQPRLAWSFPVLFWLTSLLSFLIWLMRKLDKIILLILKWQSTSFGRWENNIWFKIITRKITEFPEIEHYFFVLEHLLTNWVPSFILKPGNMKTWLKKKKVNLINEWSLFWIFQFKQLLNSWQEHENMHAKCHEKEITVHVCSAFSNSWNNFATALCF